MGAFWRAAPAGSGQAAKSLRISSYRPYSKSTNCFSVRSRVQSPRCPAAAARTAASNPFCSSQSGLASARPSKTSQCASSSAPAGSPSALRTSSLQRATTGLARVWTSGTSARTVGECCGRCLRVTDQHAAAESPGWPIQASSSPTHAAAMWPSSPSGRGKTGRRTVAQHHSRSARCTTRGNAGRRPTAGAQVEHDDVRSSRRCHSGRAVERPAARRAQPGAALEVDHGVQRALQSARSVGGQAHSVSSRAAAGTSLTLAGPPAAGRRSSRLPTRAASVGLCLNMARYWLANCWRRQWQCETPGLFARRCRVSCCALACRTVRCACAHGAGPPVPRQASAPRCRGRRAPPSGRSSRGSRGRPAGCRRPAAGQPGARQLPRPRAARPARRIAAASPPRQRNVPAAAGTRSARRRHTANALPNGRGACVHAVRVALLALAIDKPRHSYDLLFCPPCDT